MIDVPFVMEHVHPEAASTLKTTFITGHTASQKEKTKVLKEEIAQCAFKTNIALESVYLNNPYGTHHTKMMVLGFDNLTKLQVVIHTANLISFDWGNMTQGVWISPVLPLGETSTKFQTDLLEYISKYDLPATRKLMDVIKRFDFSEAKAVLIGSTPGTYAKGAPDYESWGLHKLRKVLAEVNKEGENDATDSIQAQVSSIASLGAKDTYFTPFFCSALRGEPLGGTPSSLPAVDLVFPTIQNVRDSLNGYASGSSIHFKRSALVPAQAQQLAYLKPALCSWRAVKAGRAMAAPHIKTYMRVSSRADRVRWVLLTSSNLSKQAWGNVNKAGGLWIQSFELGVLLEPNLFKSSQQAHFIPTYKRDTLQPAAPPPPPLSTGEKAYKEYVKRPKLGGIGPRDTCVAIRMPYDLATTKYNKDEEAWSPHETYGTLDWHGNAWPLTF